MNRIQKGDTVVLNAGKDKNRTGKVLQVKGERVLVEGVNIVTKHVKPNPQANQQGGFRKQEALLHSSNVSLLNPQSNKADKVGFKFINNAEGQKKKVRYFKSNDELVDLN